MSTEDRLRRHLQRTVGVDSDWELEHLMLCDVCELDAGYDGVELDRCDVARAHVEMKWELYLREHPPTPRGVGIGMESAAEVLLEMYAPAMKAQLQQDLIFFKAFGGRP